jgi:DNA-binding MarR family transcriptional regulator
MSLNRPEPASIGSVSTLLAMDRTTLTANLKPLERRRLVTVTIDNTDKRTRRLTLTPAGRAVLGSAVPVWRRTHAEIARLLTGSSPDRLRADLRALS